MVRLIPDATTAGVVEELSGDTSILHARADVVLEVNGCVLHSDGEGVRDVGSPVAHVGAGCCEVLNNEAGEALEVAGGQD